MKRFLGYFTLGLISFLFVLSLIYRNIEGGNSGVPVISFEKPRSAPVQSQMMGMIRVSDVIRYGENLWEILRKHKIPRDDALLAIEEFKKIYNTRAIRAGDRYFILQDTLNNLIAYRYQPDLTTIYEVRKDTTGQFKAAVKRRTLIRKIETLSGSVRTTLYESMRESGARPELILNFTDIFQWDVDFFIEPQPGDRYKLVYEAYYLDSLFVKYGNILAAQYVLHGQPLTAFYYQVSHGKGGYYEWSGQSFQKTFLKSPLNYRRISSYFSMGRRHPILKRVRPHFGVDFAAPAGTPVVAPADGVVIETGYQKRGVGRYLKIRHNNTRFVTLYGHLRAYARGIKKGVRVTQRQVIGYVGATGLATGPHLHYTFYENGRPINPLRIRNISADPLRAAQIAPFHRYAQRWLTLLAALPNTQPDLCVLR